MIVALSALGVLIPNAIGLATAAPAPVSSSPSRAFTSIIFDNMKASQALSFSNTIQDGFGYVTKMSIGGTLVKVLNPDLTLTNPVTGFTAPTASVGAMTYFSWAGGTADSISLQFDVSAINLNLLKASGYVGAAKVPVQLSLVIYYYDMVSGKWYAAIANTSPVALTGYTSNLAVASLPDMNITSPRVTQVTLTVFPNPTTQTIPYRSYPSTALMKAW